MEEKQEKNWCDIVKEQTEKQIENITKTGITTSNVDYLYKLVDIHKDLKNEEYWKEKINMYNEGSYGRYNEGSYGRRYRDGAYGRRGVKGTGRGRYRGEEVMNEMYNAYNDYMDSQEYGNYGTSESMMKIEIMTDSLMDFIHHLKQEAKSPEEKRMIDEKLKEIGRM